MESTSSSSSAGTASGGSLSSQQYSVILATVAELRGDLEKSISRMRILEEQNVALAKNYETTKEELLQTRKRFNELRESYENIVVEKTEMEGRNEAFIERITQQLEEKTKEFELQREKLKPQDIDSIRIKVQEELEIPHKLRIQALKAEAENYSEMYFAMKREMERLKTENELISTSYSKEIETIKGERGVERELLKKKLLEIHEQKFFATGQDDEVRSSKIQIIELSRAIENLKDEVSDIRSQRDAALIKSEESTSKYERAAISLHKKASDAEAEKLVCENRCNWLVAEGEQKSKTIANMAQTIEELTAKLGDSENQLDSLKAKVTSQTDEYTAIVESQRASKEKELRKFQQQVEMLSKRVEERENQIRRIQKENNEMQWRVEQASSEMKRNFKNEMFEANKRCLALEVQLADAKTAMGTLQIDNDLKFEQVVTESAILKSEVSRITREKEVLHDKLRSMERASDSEKTQLQKEISTLKQRISSLEMELTDIRTDFKTIDDELSTARKAEMLVGNSLHEALGLNENMAKEHARLIEAMQKEAKSRFDEIKSAYKAREEKLRKKFAAEFAREHKKASAYKEKAVLTHNYNKRLLAAGANQGLSDDE